MTDDPPRGESHGPPTESLKTPFSFKLMIVLTVLYLGWRLVEAVIWVIRRITG